MRTLGLQKKSSRFWIFLILLCGLAGCAHTAKSADESAASAATDVTSGSAAARADSSIRPATTAAISSDKKSTTAQSIGLEEMLQEKVNTAADALSWLKRCAMVCHSPDREIAKSMADGYDILYKISNQVHGPEDLTEAQKQKVLAAQDQVRDGFVKILKTKSNRELLELSYRELNGGQLLYDRDPNSQELLLAAIDRLKAKPETAATGWFLQGLSIPASEDNLLPSIQAYRSCLLIAPQDRGCRLNYDELVQYYERARCDERNFVGPIKIRIGRTSSAAAYSLSGDSEGKTFYFMPSVVLTDKDLLDSTFEVSPSIGRFDIALNLKTFSVNKLTKALQDSIVAGPESGPEVFSLSLHDKLIDVSMLTESVKDGILHLPFRDADSAKKIFSSICSKPTSDHLPQNLKL